MRNSFSTMENMVTLNWKKKGLKRESVLENGSRMSRECLENVSKTARRSRTNVGIVFARPLSLMLTLMMLLTLGVGSAWGETTIFKWQYDGSSVYGDGSNNGVFDISNTSGIGTIKFVTYEKKKTSADGTSAYASSVTDNDLKPSITKVCKLGNNGAHLRITPSSGDFKAGDVILICGYSPMLVTTSTDPTSTAKITTDTGSGGKTTVIGASVASGTGKSACAVGKDTIPAGFVETDEIYISRVPSTSVGIAAIKVVRQAAPTSLTNGETTTDSQVLSWTAPASAPENGYLVAYSSATSTAPGADVVSSTGSYTLVSVSAGNVTKTLSELSESTTYNWWVRAKGTYALSAWVAGSSFTTDAAPAGSTWYVKGGWNSWGTTDNLTGSGTELSATVNITTAGLYEFKIWNSDGDAWYGNGGNIGCNVSGWTFTNPGSNCKFFASETGNYTFTFNTSTKALSVTYPTAQGKYYYKNTSSWGTVAVYRFKGGINNGWPGTQVVETETVCGDTYYFTYADPGTTIIFNNNGGGSQTGDMTASGNAGKYVSGTGNSWTAFPTYTISYAANSGSGSMSSQTGIACGTDKATTANSFTAPSGYQFAGWKANVDVTVGGSTKTAGTVLADGVTIQNVSSNITLTAQWELIPTYDVIYNTNGGTGGSTASQTGNLSGAQVTTSANGFTKTGYKFKWWNTAANGSGEDFYPGEKVTIASADVNLYAQWEQVSDGWEFWCGSPNAFTTSQAVVGDMVLTAGGANVAINTDLTADPTIVSKYNSSVDKHAICIAVPNNDQYIQVSFSDGSPINTLKLWATTNKTESKNLAIIYSTTADFSTGEYEAKTVSVPASNAASKALTDFSPATADKYFYARIYRKVETAVYGFTGGSGNTARIYGVKAQKGANCTAPSALAAATPTAKGITLSVTDANNVNNYEFYVSTSSTAPEADATATHSVSSAKSLTITNLVAGTTYYAWARSVCGVSNKSGWTALGDGGTFTTSTVGASYTLTNVTKSSGATTGIGGSDFTAIFAGATDYNIPSTITVTIDGNTATSGTDYTWAQATGTLTIPANKINGNITVTVNSAPSAPSSAVISGTYHYFPGENISLTVIPTGNNGPTTYQWYKGGKANGNAIEGATSATYTKNNCAFADAGSYYCKVTCNATSIWANTNSNDNYDVKILRLYVNGSKGGEPYGNVDFVKVNSTTATASIALGLSWTYGFNIADGCGHYYGNAGTMQENNCTNWTTNVNGTDCGLTTTNAATYVFTINYSNLGAIVTSVTYPVSDQASDKVIYFDNDVLKWTGSSIYYRIGHSSYSQTDKLSLVSGTANLYKMTTREFNGFSGWHIANATGDAGSGKSIYKTVDGTPITKATAHEGGAVTEAAVTVTPTTSRGNGADEGVNDNCEFYNYSITSGMKTDNVAITAPTNGTITVAYTDTEGANQSFTSGNRDLAHTVIITPTATPATGYNLSSLTVNGGAHTSGNTYTCLGNTTVAATFSAKTITITWDAGEGTVTPATSSYTYNGSTVSLPTPTRAGYDFAGWWTGAGGTGTQVTEVGTTNKPAEDVTYHAKWAVADSPLVTWTMEINTASGFNPASTSTTDATHISSISSSRTGGDNKASTSCTNKVSMASAEVTGSSEPSNSAKFTFTVADDYMVVPERITCQVFNVSSGNRTYKAQISDSNGHVYNSTNTVAVSTEATLTDATFNFASSLILTGNVTMKVYAWKTSGSPTEFRMGQYVKLYGEVETIPEYEVTLNNMGATSAGTTDFTVHLGDDDYSFGSYIEQPEKTDSLFGGYYTQKYGGGVQVINNGNTINTSVTGYTDASGNWLYEGNTTLYAFWSACPSYTFHTASSGSHPWKPYTCFEQVGETNEWRITNYTIPSATKFYVGYQGLDAAKTAECAWADAPTQSAGVWQGQMVLLPEGSSVLGVGQATGATGKLVMWDTSTHKNYYVGFQPSGYGLTYAAGVEAFSYVSDHLWQTDIVTLTAADVAGTFKVGLETATPGTYADCAQTSSYTSTQMNSHKDELVSVQSYPAIPDLAADQEGRFVIWDNSDGQWWLSFLPVYTVQYDANGGSGSAPAEATKYRTNETPTVLANTYTAPTDHVFTGWNTADDGKGTSYAAGDPLAKIGSNVTLYAQWHELETYNITYHLNGASWVGGYTAPATYKEGTGATLPLAGNMTNVGYTFGGWYANEELTGGAKTSIGPAEAGDKEFWAKWTENTYTVTYDANGGTGDMSATVGHYVTLSDNTYTKSGYAFSEWNTAADGSGISYHEGEEIELTADLDLYAIWATDYTITWGNVQIGGAGATVTPNLGGGNYTITASVSDWTGTLTVAMLTAETAGLTITNVSIDNSSSPKTITATFSVGATVAGDTVALLLSLPAAGVYGAKDSEKVIDIERCEGVSIAWDFNSMSATDFSTSSPGTEGNKNSISASTGSGTIYYFAGSSDAIKSWSKGKPVVLYLGGTAGSGSVGGNSTYTNRCFYIDITSNGTLTITNHEDQNGAPSYQVTGAIRPGTSGYSSVSAKGSGSDAYVYEITVDSYNASTANRIWVAYTSSKAYINNITWTPSGGSGTITPTLTWSPALASGATVDKYDTDGDFTYAASTTSNTLGTITYTSSDATVATVNSSGKVHILKSGVTTITATLAESGCYESAAITYTLNVISTCADVAGTLSAINLGCDGIQLTVSGHTGEGEVGTVINWYKDGVLQNNASYNNKATVTVTAAGEWYAQTTAGGVGHCVRNSNSITVAASESVTASKIVDEWYVKNGRRTPDVALVQTANAVNFSVAFANGGTKIWDSSTGTPVTTGFGGCDFHINESTGVIYLNGSSSAGAAPTGMTVGDTTITITAQGCGSSASVTVRLHVQDATTYKTIAYVVDGTKGGAWDAVTSGHADGTQLYEYLDSVGTGVGARKFMLSERNIYKTVDEKLIREHYSQFDAILITDDPNTSTKDGKKSYVDAFGTMIDVRPLLTMEAYVSALANWSCVKGSPTSPNPRQYTMRLQCKDHEIYSGLPAPAAGTHVWSETIDGDEYRFVIMVDSTKSPYKGVGATSETSDKPALQGFSSAAMGDLLGLGVISNGALQAGIERQEEPAARMMILGINNKALPNALTDEGKKVIENALTYLLKTNMEEVDDCSNFFKGGTEGHETDWNTTTNWQKGTLPTFETKVRILAPCEISGGIKPRVAQVDIAASGTSSKIPGGTCSGSLTIKPDGGLIVAGKVRSAVAPYFNNSDLNPTTPAILTIEANSTNTGALILDNSDGTTQATVEMYSKSYWEIVAGKKKKYWSYVGVPITDVDIPNYFYLGFTYLYDETTGWIKKSDGSVLQPFEGIGLSMQEGNRETFQGTLASTETQEIALTKTTSGGNGENLIGNSWTAPIQITAFEASDFGSATATVSVYNSGRDDYAGNPTYVTATEENDGAATAGQWLSVPISVSKLGGYTGLKVIPAMQAFQVTTSSATTLTLDYDKLVRPATNTVNAPMRAPKRKAPPQAEIEGLLRVRVSGETTHTDVWLLKDERFDYGFDNGWEASYQECDERSAQLYALSEIGKMAFLAQPEIDGTVLGFAPSRDGDEYTFSFHYLGNETLYLNDLKQQSSTLISEENIYRFTYEEGDTHRFLISATPFGAPGITTGVSETGDGARVQKIIYRDHVYIIRGGRIYDVVGKVVK